VSFPPEESPQGGRRAAPRGSNGSAPPSTPPDLPPTPPPRLPLLRLALLFYSGLLGVALLWAAFSGRSPFYASALAERDGIDGVRDLGAGLLAGAIVIAVSWELTRRTRWGDALARALAALLGPLSLASCVWLAVLSGVAEEAFFRGALQPRLGIVGASLLFGLAHFAPRREFLPWTFFSIAAGLLFGVLFDTTGNLLAPIAAHFLINAVNLRLLARLAGPRAR
jgi:CAAX protease family protein